MSNGYPQVCPQCAANLVGEKVFDLFLKKYDGDEARAIETAEMYGATKEAGHFMRVIGIYDRDLDRTTSWRCPDCNHEWARNF